jgi:hypothetical protein
VSNILHIIPLQNIVKALVSIISSLFKFPEFAAVEMLYFPNDKSKLPSQIN